MAFSAIVLLGSTLWGQMPAFRDALAGSGIEYVNVAGEPEKRYILSTLGSGIGLLDYDEDGDLDLYLVNGARLVEGRVEQVAGDRLYRNEGSWRFTDVTERAGLGHPGWGIGVTVGDYDNDGLADVYVTNVGPNLLYRNLGDGTFAEVAAAAGVDDDRWGTSAAFFDADGDGDVDLYVANYVDVDLGAIPPPGKEPRCQWFGIEVMCGPKGLPGSSDVFYTNGADGTFEEATEASGLLDPTGAYALGVVVGDYDDDADLDVYVANDSVPNFLYQNDGNGRFQEVAFLSGVALSSEGLAQAGMGVDMGDVNGDGELDLFVTNFSHETNNAYVNHGGGLFLDSVGEANMHGPSWFALGWGTRFVDLDHDGDLDVFVSNGHVYPGVDETNLKTAYHQPNQIFWNDGTGAFSERDVHPDDAMARVASSRAAAFGDLDGDGDLDGVVINIDSTLSLLENRLGRERDWIRLRLVGRRSVRDANGARAVLFSGERRLERESHVSGSFLSASSPWLHYGVPGGRSIDRIELRWPSGAREVVGPLEPGQSVIVLEGVGPVTAR